jgi:hypothetical protein
MPITRTFTITCNKCGQAFGQTGDNATELRQQAKTANWSISGNRFTCTICNGRSPQAGDLAHRPE